MADETSHQFPTTIGQLDILEPATLLYHSPIQEWSVHQIKGGIRLNHVHTALINLQAQGGHLQHSSDWNLRGRADLNAHRSLNLDLMLSCSAQGKSDGKIELALEQVSEGSKHAKVHCENLSYVACGFLQTLLATYWPVFNEVTLEDGELNASIEADLVQQGIGELHIKQLEASHVCSKFKAWQMTCDFGQIRGYGKIHLGQENCWQSLNAGFHLEDGRMRFNELSSPLPIDDIQAHFLIQQGDIEHSLVTLQVAGLKGKMDVEWGEQKQMLTFKLDGLVEDLADLFPNQLEEGLRRHFYQNRLMVLANLKRQNQQMEIGGTLHIERANSEQMDLIHFGCELKKNQEFKYVPVGWFHAHQLPLDKFLSPFIFQNGILQLSGEAELKGSFDDRLLLIKYDADHLRIENENLCIEVPQLQSSIPGQLLGSHQIDLQTYAYQGTLPIQSASYFEKNTGLIFQGIQGMVTFKNDFIRISPLESYCEGVYFAGELELDYADPSPGVFNLMIHCPTLSGKVSQIQHLLAHLDQPSLFHQIPLEGDVTGKAEGLRLNFAFVPDDYHLQASARGVITEGVLPFEKVDMALRGIDMDIEYNHQRQLLEFSEIQGTLLVGKPRRVEEYLLTGQHIRFYQISEPEIDVDIAIKDHEHELVRLVGYTRNEADGNKSIYLNSALSHLSCLYPNVWQCQLKDWSHLEQFTFRSQFDLGKFLQDLGHFRQTGLLFLSPGFLERISEFSLLKGEGLLDLRYQPDQNLTYHLEGSYIKQEDSSEHFGFLKGSKRDKKWIIDQLQWDDWNIYAELHQLPEKWRIPFLGLKAGQTILLGLEGDWLQEEALLKAKLKFCEVNLSQLDHFPILQSFITKWWPKGTLNATGDVEWNLLASHLLEGCKVSLLAEIQNFTLRDYPLKILNPFKMVLQPHHRFSLENVQIKLAAQNKASIDLQHFEYLFSQEAIHSLKALFQIHHPQLEDVGEKLHHHFPDLLDSSAKEILIASKQQGQLKGELTIENHAPNQNILRLGLEDGLYIFKKRQYDLRQFHLEIVGDALQFSAFSQEERCPFQILGQTQWPICREGQVKLISLDTPQPLVIEWKNQPEGKWAIRSLQGDFNGCSFLLREDREGSSDSEWAALQGQVTVDFNSLRSILAPDIAANIEKLKVGSLYSFIGRFWMNPDWGATLLDTVSFKGKMMSEEAILKGYQMQNLQADMQYVPGRLDIQNLLIEDFAGNIKAPHCVVMRDAKQDQWTFFIPRLIVKNLRVNLLQDIETHAPLNPKFRSLVLKRVDFQDLRGALGDVQTWQGQGNLHFLNSSRRNPLHTLLAIPAEIILRLGLDPHVLNPVTGTIYFYLQDRRFYLTRFKDVYSEGRGSKFYLARRTEPSWMDLDGNLSVHIGMKQYNLIFKIAELFTVSVQGNLQKPRYTLQKQSKNSSKERRMPIIKVENS
jgi:hypothetical protein